MRIELIDDFAKMNKTQAIGIFLKALTEHSSIKNILEIGSGTHSTAIIRKTLQEKQFGFCLSLENNPLYHKCLTANELPDDSFGEIEFSPLIYDEMGLHYSFILKDKYDFMYIDGPGNSTYIDKKDGLLKEAKPLIYKFLSLPQNWLNTNTNLSMAGGRMFMLDYVKDAMHEDTIVMVDSSSARAMIYFFQKYRDKFIFQGFGGETTRRKIERTIKPEYLEIFKKINYWPQKINIMYKKDSKNAPIIIEDVLKKIVAKNHEK